MSDIFELLFLIIGFLWLLVGGLFLWYQAAQVTLLSRILNELRATRAQPGDPPEPAPKLATWPPARTQVLPTAAQPPPEASGLR
jgi:hypothetical protein